MTAEAINAAPSAATTSENPPAAAKVPESLAVRSYRWLIWLTLYAAILHFFDNVYFFADYPEPSWLSPGVVGALLVPMALLAHRAARYCEQGRVQYSFSLTHAFVFGNWLSLGHYLFASPVGVLPRINAIIGLQVGLATLLFFLISPLSQLFPHLWERQNA